MMTVQQLVQQLQDAFDPDTVVVLSSDAEGNEFHYVTEIGRATADDVEVSVPGFSAVDTEVAVLWP